MAFRLFGIDFSQSLETSFKDLGRAMGSDRQSAEGKNQATTRYRSSKDGYRPPSHADSPPSPSPLLSRARAFFFGPKSS